MSDVNPARRFPVHLNCPHCQSPLEFVADDPDEDVVCPSCGSSFRIDNERTQTWTKGHLPKLGRFELIEAVGRGAFGTVYRALDTELHRTVAVKVPRSGRLVTDEDEDRFVREARSVANLHHPGIVPVYEVGRSATFPFIVAEYVDGVTLADALTGRKFSVRESARLVASVAEALEHAHSQGVVHRDLKPSNIMLTADDVPRVMDFGLAKRDAGEVTVTVDGQVLGTPAYMSPEQAAGRSHHVDGRSDVYSLGGILYELLTGELPFRGNQRMILHQVLYDEPRSLRSLNDRIPRDLETIALKAMAKEPSRRYQTARALAEDLERYLAGKPILARPVGRIERAWRWCKRNPAVAALLAAVLVTSLTGTTVSTRLYLRAEAQRAIAIDERQRADTQAAEATASALRAQEEETKANREAQRAKREAETANAATEFMTSVFQTTDMIGLAGTGVLQEGEKPQLLTLEEVLRRASQRVRTELQGQPLLQARLMSTIGNINRSLGSYQDAQQLLRESLDIRQRELSASPEEGDQLAIADSQFNLAWLLHDLGNYKEAEPLYREALAARMAVLQPTDSLVTTAKFNLAWLLVDSDQHAEAERLFREVLKIRRDTLPPGHRDLTLAEIGLAAMLWTRGKHSEIIKETLPTVSGDVLIKAVSLYELARVQRSLHNLQAAARLYESIVEVARNSLPERHPVLAAILVDMAGLLKDQGDYPAAEKAMREALDIVRKVMGGHPRLIEPLREFAVQLSVRGDFDEAEQLHRESLRIFLQRRPGQRNGHIDTMYRIAEVLRQRGRYEAAKKTLADALQIQPEPNGDAAHDGPRSILARTTYEEGDWQGAQALYEKLLSEPRHAASTDLRLAWRECAAELGQLDAARERLDQVTSSFEGFDETAAHSLDGLRDAAATLASVGSFPKALATARELLKRSAKAWPSDHPELVRDRAVFVQIVLQSREAFAPEGFDEAVLAQADKLLTDNERCCRRQLGADHPWLAQNHLVRARLAASQGDASTAVAQATEAVRILGAHFSGDHPWLLKARYQLAEHHRQANQVSAAATELRQLLADFPATLPAHHEDIFETRLALADATRELGNAAAAETMLRELLEESIAHGSNAGRRAGRVEAVLGSALTAEKRFAEAEQALTHSQTILASLYGQNHTRTRQVVQAQIELYEAWEKPDRAAELRRQLAPQQQPTTNPQP